MLASTGPRATAKLRIILLITCMIIPLSLQLSSVHAATLAVGSDKNEYNKSETVYITGTLTNGDSPIVGADIAIEVKNDLAVKVFEAQVKTNGTGAFSTNLSIPNSFRTGQYTIYAAYQSDRAQSTFTIVSRFTLDSKTNPAGTAWASGTYLLGAKVNQTSSSGPSGDQSATSTTFTPTVESLSVTLGSGDKLLLIGASQLWNDNPAVGSSICISRNGTRISGDMFAVGASPIHRHLATAIAVDSPAAGTYTYTLDFKTNPTGKAWASGTYLLAVKISDSWSDGPTGDQSTTSTSFTSTAENVSVTVGSGEKLLLIGTSQLWNDNPAIGSSICISRDGAIISGDMFAVGASANHRHLATAVAADSTIGSHTYTLDFKTDPGGKAWASGTYLLAVKISQSYSSGPTGDQSTTSNTFTPTAEDLNLGIGSGDKLLVIGTSQLWNNNPPVGSSICVSKDGTRISGDMFAVGASLSHRHLATAIAVWTAP